VRWGYAFALAWALIGGALYVWQLLQLATDLG
jgi:hypothetical protein